MANGVQKIVLDEDKPKPKPKYVLAHTRHAPQSTKQTSSDFLTDLRHHHHGSDETRRTKTQSRTPILIPTMKLSKSIECFFPWRPTSTHFFCTLNSHPCVKERSRATEKKYSHEEKISRDCEQAALQTIPSHNHSFSPVGTNCNVSRWFKLPCKSHIRRTTRISARHDQLSINREHQVEHL